MGSGATGRILRCAAARSPRRDVLGTQARHGTGDSAIRMLPRSDAAARRRSSAAVHQWAKAHCARRRRAAFCEGAGAELAPAARHGGRRKPSESRRCASAAVPQCLSASVPQCLGASVPQCLSASCLVPQSSKLHCFTASLLQCFSAVVRWCGGAVVRWCGGVTRHAATPTRYRDPSRLSATARARACAAWTRWARPSARSAATASRHARTAAGPSAGCP